MDFPSLSKLHLKTTLTASNIRALYHALALALLAWGLALRIRAYAGLSSLTYDEALLALNLMKRSYAGLLLPLEMNQGAPQGFLAASKLAIQVFGNRDYVLKLLPLVFGVLSLFLLYRLARHFHPLAALVGLGLFIASDALVFFSVTFKQYSGDVAICLGLLVLAVEIFSGRPSWKGWAAWGLASALSVWFSHPAVFVAAGISLVEAVRCLRGRDWKRLLVLCLASLGWSAGLAAIYVLSLQNLSANPKLLDYWGSAFMPLPPWKDPLWFIYALRELAASTVSPAPAWLAAALLLLGAFSLPQRDRRLGALFLAPVLLALLASGLQKYPFSARLLLFLAPVAALLIGEGVVRIYTWLRPYPWLAAGAAALACVVLLARPALSAGERLYRPYIIENLRPVMEYLQQGRKWGDAIYVYYGAIPAFQYYAPQYGIKEDWVQYGSEFRGDPEKYLQDLSPSMGENRLWLVFTHVSPLEQPAGGITDEEQYLLAYLNETGRQMEHFYSQGASVYLFRPQRKSLLPTAVTPAWATNPLRPAFAWDQRL